MINWQQFGLRSNPYDTFPLIEGGELPIKKAFVGRDAELGTLREIFYSDSRACVTILGNVGVGKTSFANFHKFLFKYDEPEKPLFSFRREIEATKHLLTKHSFLIEIIGSTLREIRLLNPELIKKETFLKKLERLVDVTQSWDISAGLSIAGFGGDFGRGAGSDYPPNIPISILEGYFYSLIEFIKTHKIAGKKFKGLIVHVNNFDVVLSDPANKKDVLSFFQEIRDLLQTKDVYFLFLGPQHFFRDIISAKARIKSIFSLSPIIISPLTKNQVSSALRERLSLLKSPDVVKPIPPCSDEVIYELYDLYNGDVRSIMNGLTAILSQVAETVVEPLDVEEAMLLLGQERWNLLKMNVSLTHGQEEVLKFLATTDNYITQKDLAMQLNKAQSNISGYYINPLMDAGIIEVKRQDKLLKYWGLTSEYTPIKYILKSKETIQQKALADREQLGLFSKK